MTMARRMKTMSEFKRGDVVVEIGGSNAFVISGAYQTTMWYSVQYLWNGQIYHADKSKFDLDSDYVKVDFCKNVFDDNVVHDKLVRIVRAFRGT